MSYTIFIEYSNNLKLGKLSVLNKENKTVLNKVKVSIPKKLTTDIPNIKLMNLVEQSELIRFDDDKAYQNALQEFKNNKKDTFFVNGVNEQQLLLVPQAEVETGTPLRIDNEAFVVSQNDFESIKSIIKNEETSITVKKVSMLWFSQTATTPASNVGNQYKQFLSILSKLEDYSLFSNDVFEIENKRKNVKDKSLQQSFVSSKLSIGINKKAGTTV